MHFNEIHLNLEKKYHSCKLFPIHKPVNCILADRISRNKICYEDIQPWVDDAQYLNRFYKLCRIKQAMSSIKQHYFYEPQKPIHFSVKIAEIYEKWKNKKKQIMLKNIKQFYSLNSSHGLSNSKSFHSLFSNLLHEISEYDPNSSKYKPYQIGQQSEKAIDNQIQFFNSSLKNVLNSFSLDISDINSQCQRIVPQKEKINIQNLDFTNQFNHQTFFKDQPQKLKAVPNPNNRNSNKIYSKKRLVTPCNKQQCQPKANIINIDKIKNLSAFNNKEQTEYNHSVFKGRSVSLAKAYQSKAIKCEGTPPKIKIRSLTKQKNKENLSNNIVGEGIILNRESVVCQFQPKQRERRTKFLYLNKKNPCTKTKNIKIAGHHISRTTNNFQHKLAPLHKQKTGMRLRL